MESGLIVSAGSGSNFTPIEPGTYPAVCYGLVDLGVQYNAAFDSSSRKVIVMWEIPSETIKTDDGEKSRVISETYTASIGEKANLRKVLEAWRGKAFTEEELNGFSLMNIVGAGCMLNVIQQESTKGKTFSKVSAIMRLPKGMEAPAGTLDHVIFDLGADDALEKLETLPEWIQKRIKESETYKELIANVGFTDVPKESEELLPWEEGFGK